jgi:cell wall assembly regulator SMI1
MTNDHRSSANKRGFRQAAPSAILRRLQALCADWPDYGRAFAKAATEKQLREFVRSVRRMVPTPFLKFYSWCNGSRDRPVYGYYRLLSLREIVRYKGQMDDMERDGFFDSWRSGTWWNDSWLPFLEENGNLFCLDASVRPVPNVVEFYTHDDPRNVVFPSFQAWLHSFVATLDAAPRSSEQDRIEFFESRRASSMRRSLYPDYPIRRRAESAPRPAHCHPKLTLSRNNFQRGPYNWCIDRAGALVQITYGRAYSLTVRRRRFPDLDAAQDFLEREIARKRKAGYHPASMFQTTADDDFLRDASEYLRTLGRR